MTTDNIALIDLDGTLADYDAAMRVEMQTLQAPSEPPYTPRFNETKELPHMEARRKLIQRRPGFWRGLEPIRLGFQVVNALRDAEFDLHILTKGPSNNGGAWGEKLEWAEKHVPDAIVHVTGDKSLVYGRVLMDDYPPYFLKWLQVRPRGLVICVAQTWNAEFANNKNANVVRYDGTNMAEVTDRIRRARERQGGEHG